MLSNDTAIGTILKQFIYFFSVHIHVIDSLHNFLHSLPTFFLLGCTIVPPLHSSSHCSSNFRQVSFIPTWMDLVGSTMACYPLCLPLPFITRDYSTLSTVLKLEVAPRRHIDESCAIFINLYMVWSLNENDKFKFIGGSMTEGVCIS